MNKWCASFWLMVAGSLPISAQAEILEFVCVWDGKEKTTISVDTNKLTATRDDGGSSYKVLNITNKAVFLQLDLPYWSAVTIQILERPSGGWHEIIVIDDGQVAPFEGGMCIENS